MQAGKVEKESKKKSGVWYFVNKLSVRMSVCNSTEEIENSENASGGGS